MIILSQF